MKVFIGGISRFHQNTVYFWCFITGLQYLKFSFFPNFLSPPFFFLKLNTYYIQGC